jgi:hypothetical protein
VDVAWKDGELSSATVRAKYAGPCRLRTALPISVRHADNEVAVRRIDTNTIEFSTSANAFYSIRPQL